MFLKNEVAFIWRQTFLHYAKIHSGFFEDTISFAFS